MKDGSLMDRMFARQCAKVAHEAIERKVRVVVRPKLWWMPGWFWMWLLGRIVRVEMLGQWVVDTGCLPGEEE